MTNLLSDGDLAPSDSPPRAPVEALDPASLGAVSIVHDYLSQYGGAEQVVLELESLWPGAPIYTSLYRPGSTFEAFGQLDVRTTRLDQLPVDTGFRNLFPFYPAAFRSLGEIPGDVVISSSSGWAHMARVAPGALHVVYCHTPARWLYRSDYLNHIGGRSLRHAMIRPVGGMLRRRDRAAALRADLYLANSRGVQQRIRDAYGIEAAVVCPPVHTGRFVPKPRGERLLVVSRLMPYKRVDLVVRAAMALGIGLDIVGDGPRLGLLREIAGPDVTFHGATSAEDLVALLEGCRAVCMAGEEDFGIVAVEAQAAGKPVIAYGRGGVVETVEENVTGVFFHEQTAAAVVAAIRASERITTSPQAIAAHAQCFGREQFARSLVAAISERRQQLAGGRSSWPDRAFAPTFSER